jgi:hypothetical protein
LGAFVEELWFSMGNSACKDFVAGKNAVEAVFTKEKSANYIPK